MISCIVIEPSDISNENIYNSIDLMGKFIMGNDNIISKNISENKYLEEIIPFLNFTNELVGDTDLVFYNENYAYKMLYCSNKEFQRNVLGSIFHPEGIVIYHDASRQVFKRTFEKDE